MELALQLWVMLYQPPVDQGFKIIPAAIVEVVEPIDVPAPIVPQPGYYFVPPVQTVSTPEPQGIRPEPTGCYWGDSIPMDACDKVKQ